MIDLMRTRPGVDPYTAGCAQLLASIIADAITCAASPPRINEKKLQLSMNTIGCDAARSIWFLFDDASLFRLYAKLIGLDAEAIRDALLGRRKEHQGVTLNPQRKKNKGLTANQKRNLLTRYEWYCRLRDSTPGYEPIMLQIDERTNLVANKKSKSSKKKEPEYVRYSDVWDYALKQSTKDD